MCRSLLLIIVGVGAGCAPNGAIAATLIARFFPLTGEVQMENQDSTAVPLVFYSIKSSAGALFSSPTRWVSITEHYDAPIAPSPGNGLVDPDGSWFPISSKSIELAEGALDVDGGRIPAFRSVSLGRIWNTAFPFISEFEAFEPSGQPISIIPIEAVAGDYNRNGVVDAADYAMWRKFFGTSGTKQALQADGNLNGIVDAGDYSVWRSNFGRSTAGTAAGIASDFHVAVLAAAAAVPEPASAGLLVIAAGMLTAARGLRGRSRQ